MNRSFFEQLVLQKYPLLYGYAFQVLRNHYLSEDMVMDTFHTGWEKLDELYHHENPAGWLIVVLKNKIGNYLTTSKRESQLLTQIQTQQLQNPISNGSNAGSSMHVLLLSIRQMLPEEDYRFLVSHYIYGLQYAELAQQYHCTVWSCRKRMQRIRQRLQAAFPEEFKK